MECGRYFLVIHTALPKCANTRKRKPQSRRRATRPRSAGRFPALRPKPPATRSRRWPHRTAFAWTRCMRLPTPPNRTSHEAQPCQPKSNRKPVMASQGMHRDQQPRSRRKQQDPCDLHSEGAAGRWQNDAAVSARVNSSIDRLPGVQQAVPTVCLSWRRTAPRTPPRAGNVDPPLMDPAIGHSGPRLPSSRVDSLRSPSHNMQNTRLASRNMAIMNANMTPHKAQCPPTSARISLAHAGLMYA